MSGAKKERHEMYIAIPAYQIAMLAVGLAFTSGIMLALVTALVLVMLFKNDKGPSIDTKYLADCDHLLD